MKVDSRWVENPGSMNLSSADPGGIHKLASLAHKGLCNDGVVALVIYILMLLEGKLWARESHQWSQHSLETPFSRKWQVLQGRYSEL